MNLTPCPYPCPSCENPVPGVLQGTHRYVEPYAPEGPACPNISGHDPNHTRSYVECKACKVVFVVDTYVACACGWKAGESRAHVLAKAS